MHALESFYRESGAQAAKIVRERKKASRRENCYGALALGILTWFTLLRRVEPGFIVLFCIAFSVFGIILGMRALNTNEGLAASERLAAWVGIILCVAIYGYFIAKIFLAM